MQEIEIFKRRNMHKIEMLDTQGSNCRFIRAKKRFEVAKFANSVFVKWRTLLLFENWGFLFLCISLQQSRKGSGAEIVEP